MNYELRPRDKGLVASDNRTLLRGVNLFHMFLHLATTMKGLQAHGTFKSIRCARSMMCLHVVRQRSLRLVDLITLSTGIQHFLGVSLRYMVGQRF